MKRRLISMARAGGLCFIPEGTEKIPARSMVPFFCIDRVFWRPVGESVGEVPGINHVPEPP